MILSIRVPGQYGNMNMAIWSDGKDLLSLVGALHFSEADIPDLLLGFLVDVITSQEITTLSHPLPILDYKTGTVTVVTTTADLLDVFPRDVTQVPTLLSFFSNFTWDSSLQARETFLRHFAFEDLDAPYPLHTLELGPALTARAVAAGVSLTIGAYRELEEAYEDVELRVIEELYTESAPSIELLRDLYEFNPSLLVIDELGKALAEQPRAYKHITLSHFLRPGWPYSRIRRSYEFKVCVLGLNLGYVTWSDPDAGPTLPQQGDVVKISDYTTKTKEDSIEPVN